MTQTDLQALMQDEMDQLEGLSARARQRMRELAQELAAEFAQNLQQEMAAQTGAVMSASDEEGAAVAGRGGFDTGAGDGWLASAMSSAFNQAITRIAQGKSLSSKTAITAMLSQPARQLGTQWGAMFAEGGYTQLRLSDGQYAADLWTGLTSGFGD